MLLAIETSCDETGVAVFALESKQPVAELLASQCDLHREYGGVVPELAARQHIINLPVLVDSVLQQAGCSADDLQAIAVTCGPGLKGCLLVGVSFAKSLALSLNVPLIPVHHIEAHIAAGFLLPADDCPRYPFIALVVSGGHTMLVEVSDFRTYRLLAETRDDAAGEAFDKIATVLSLPYPGGPALAKVAEQGNPTAFAFPIGVADDPHSFSFSGLKTAVARAVAKVPEEQRTEDFTADMAASAQQAIVAALVDKTVAACRQTPPTSVLLTGGVAANRRLREAMRSALAPLGIRFCVPEHRWCTDNAAMVGVLAQEIRAQNKAAFAEWRDNPKGLGPDAPWEVAARARWPIAHQEGGN